MKKNKRDLIQSMIKDLPEESVRNCDNCVFNWASDGFKHPCGQDMKVWCEKMQDFVTVNRGWFCPMFVGNFVNLD